MLRFIPTKILSLLKKKNGLILYNLNKKARRIVLKNNLFYLSPYFLNYANLMEDDDLFEDDIIFCPNRRTYLKFYDEEIDDIYQTFLKIVNFDLSKNTKIIRVKFGIHLRRDGKTLELDDSHIIFSDYESLLKINLNTGRFVKLDSPFDKKLWNEVMIDFSPRDMFDDLRVLDSDTLYFTALCPVFTDFVKYSSMDDPRENFYYSEIFTYKLSTKKLTSLLNEKKNFKYGGYSEYFNINKNKNLICLSNDKTRIMIYEIYSGNTFLFKFNGSELILIEEKQNIIENILKIMPIGDKDFGFLIDKNGHERIIYNGEPIITLPENGYKFIYFGKRIFIVYPLEDSSIDVFQI